MHPGQVIDEKYRIVRRLGAGAMGAVYEGENTRIHRRVAIKVLLPELALRHNALERFEREAQAAGRIGNEHIVEVLDLGVLPNGGYFMVMELLDGVTLADRIRGRGRIEPREIVPIVQQVLAGLEAAHRAGIVHRDLKPANIFLLTEHAGQRDFVKVLDFGVSKFSPLHDDGLGLTRTGAVVGTPYYMSPEQAKGQRDLDARTDLYSTGVVMYEAVTGQMPFHATTYNELIFKIVLETPPPPELFVPDLDPVFARILRRTMARDRDDRYGSAAELRDVLSRWLHTGRDGAISLPAPPASAGTVVLDPSPDTPLAPLSPAAGSSPLEPAAAGATEPFPPQVPGPLPVPRMPRSAPPPEMAPPVGGAAARPPSEPPPHRSEPPLYGPEGSWPSGGDEIVATPWPEPSRQLDLQRRRRFAAVAGGAATALAIGAVAAVVVLARPRSEASGARGEAPVATAPAERSPTREPELGDELEEALGEPSPRPLPLSRPLPPVPVTSATASAAPSAASAAPSSAASSLPSPVASESAPDAAASAESAAEPPPPKKKKPAVPRPGGRRIKLEL
jgi:serine/threonine-protein kinase